MTSEAALASTVVQIHNDRMVIHGIVQNGMVVLDGEIGLPEGALVAVMFPIESGVVPIIGSRRVEFPLVHSKHPGSLNLTSHQIGDILDEEEFSGGR